MGSIRIGHIPVMIKEVGTYINCKPSGVYVDGTLGGGGHALEILKWSAPAGRLIGIDWDDLAIQTSKERLKDFQHRVTFIHDNFKHIESILQNLGIHEVDGIVLDLGLSSIQLEDKERGFSFRSEGPIDMRMDKSSTIKAFDLVSCLSVHELERIFWKYGEERFARRIASFIVERRKTRPIETAKELAEIVRNAIPAKFHPKAIHPATRTFQAIRIVVNDELRNLEAVIRTSIAFLRKRARFCIISFHSLEDRMVKQSFRLFEKLCTCPPDMPKCNCKKVRKIRVLTKKPIIPSEEEVKRNPRARTAKLRVAERL